MGNEGYVDWEKIKKSPGDSVYVDRDGKIIHSSKTPEDIQNLNKQQGKEQKKEGNNVIEFPNKKVA